MLIGSLWAGMTQIWLTACLVHSFNGLVRLVLQARLLQLGTDSVISRTFMVVLRIYGKFTDDCKQPRSCDRNTRSYTVVYKAVTYYRYI